MQPFPKRTNADAFVPGKSLSWTGPDNSLERLEQNIKRQSSVFKGDLLLQFYYASGQLLQGECYGKNPVRE